MRGLRTVLAHPARVAAAAAVPATLLTPVVAGRRVSDTSLYLEYAEAILDGRLPYRDVAVEYPPLAFLPMLAARLVGGAGEGAYALAFAAVMAGLAAALAATVADTAARLGADRRHALAAGLVAAVAPLLSGTVAGARYDLWPTLLAALAVAAAVRGRPGVAGVLLGLGVAAKLWPGVLVPTLAAWAWRRAGRSAAIRLAIGLVATLCAVAAGPLLVGAAGLGDALGRQAGRPLQLESVGAAALVVGHHVADALGRDGAGLVVVTGSGSQNVEGPGAGFAEGLLGVLQPAAVLLVVVLGVRAVLRGADPSGALVAGVAAASLAVAVTGRVLSPQFVLWLIPGTALLAVRPERAARLAAALVGGAWLATGIHFPWWYWTYARLDPVVAVLVLARDVLLLAALVLVARLLARMARDGAPARRYAASRSSR